MKRLDHPKFVAFCLALLLFAAPLSACGEGAEAPSDSGSASQGAAEDQPPATDAADTAVDIPMGDMTLGNPDAPVTVIEYASMTCNHCANFHEYTYQKLKENYIDTGKILFVFREFPLDRYALEASVMARCAGEDAYFDIVDELFAEQQVWIAQQNISAALRATGRKYGVSTAEYEACQANEQLLARIGAKVTEAQNRYGVRGTPAIVINGQLLEEAPSYPNVSAAIEEELAQ